MLYVAADNTGAINLYTSLGFKEWGVDLEDMRFSPKDKDAPSLREQLVRGNLPKF